MDCGLISLKDRDSYAKRAGRTGIFNSGPSDRDLADQIGSAQVLIGAVVSESGGWGSKGEWSGGGTPPACTPAAAQRRSSPRAVLRGSFRPVLGSGVSSALRMMHLGQKQGTTGLCSPGMAAAVALRGQAHRREAVRGFQGPRLPRLAQKERGAVQVLTAELKGRCCRVGRPAARSCGSPRRRSRQGSAVLLRASGYRGSTCGTPAKPDQGSTRVERL
jgi:hypothetical protein